MHKINGFSNLSTWNLLLYIMGDEDIGRAVYDIMKQNYEGNTLFSQRQEDELQDLFSLFQDKGDILTCIDLKEVNYTEITLKVMQTIRDGGINSHVLKAGNSHRRKKRQNAEGSRKSM